MYCKEPSIIAQEHEVILYKDINTIDSISGSGRK